MSKIRDMLISTKKSIDTFILPNKKLYLNYINSKHPSMEFFKYPLQNTDIFYEETRGLLIHEVIIRSFLAANQQFCFWYNEFNPNLRTKFTSGLINKICLKNEKIEDIYLAVKTNILSSAVLLREERLNILNLSYNHCYYVGDSYGIQDFDDIISYLYNFDNFHHDLFRKKANYFIMDIIRYYRFIVNNQQNIIFEHELIEDQKQYINSFISFIEKEILPYHLPAIDYQIPRGLRSLGIINFPQTFENQLERVIGKDSLAELTIRSVTYLALMIIHNKVRFYKTKEAKEKLSFDEFKKLGFKDLGVLHEEIDSNIFFNRDNYHLNAHKCVTTNY